MTKHAGCAGPCCMPRGPKYSKVYGVDQTGQEVSFRVPVDHPVFTSQEVSVGYKFSDGVGSITFDTQPNTAQHPLIYVASRALPERAAMWKLMRDEGKAPIISSWINHAGQGEGEPDWVLITEEIKSCTALILYAKLEDFPLKGAFIEAGMALAFGKPVYVICADFVPEERSCRPIGSWIKHPGVFRYHNVVTAVNMIMNIQPLSEATK